MTGLAIDVPNLDDATTDPKELWEFGRRLTLLAGYAAMKAQAMSNRAAGKIELAQLDEDYCQRMYESLPQEWRW